MYFQNYIAKRSIILESFTSPCCIRYSRPCCIRYTNSRLRLEFVYLIQHGRSCCKYYIFWKINPPSSIENPSTFIDSCTFVLICYNLFIICFIILIKFVNPIFFALRSFNDDFGKINFENIKNIDCVRLCTCSFKNFVSWMILPVLLFRSELVFPRFGFVSRISFMAKHVPSPLFLHT